MRWWVLILAATLVGGCDKKQADADKSDATQKEQLRIEKLRLRADIERDRQAARDRAEQSYKETVKLYTDMLERGQIPNQTVDKNIASAKKQMDLMTEAADLEAAAKIKNLDAGQ